MRIAYLIIPTAPCCCDTRYKKKKGEQEIEPDRRIGTPYHDITTHFLLLSYVFSSRDDIQHNNDTLIVAFLYRDE